jgi:hypothetical protein
MIPKNCDEWCDQAGMPNDFSREAFRACWNTATMRMKSDRLIWGKCVDPGFRNKLVVICWNLKIIPDHLMACIAFETGRTFSPSIRNLSGSGAVGLIQFMIPTAKELGTTIEKLAIMSAVDQLDFVEKYFRNRIAQRGPIQTIEDLYMAILWPAAIGKPVEFKLFIKGELAYTQNFGLDAQKKGWVTKADACAMIYKNLEDGKRFII